MKYTMKVKIDTIKLYNEWGDTERKINMFSFILDPRSEYLNVSIKLGEMKETIKVKMDSYRERGNKRQSLNAGENKESEGV